MARDPLSPEQRSELMGRIRAKDTKPEMVVRRLAHALGYRFRIHSSKLPGRPDLVFPARRKAVFVHGCFWHAHPGCRRAFSPKTRPDYWRAKLDANRERDARAVSQLEKQGWSVLVIWECEVGDPSLADHLSQFLGAPSMPKGEGYAVHDQR
jgi:DNA mismatch endonuclease Vsr